VFSEEAVKRIIHLPTSTMPQIRDKIIFVLGICTLARASELASLLVEDICFVEDGMLVSIRRKKASVSRSEQSIWVCSKFFGWDLMDNLKKYLKLIPPTGALWRPISPQPKTVISPDKVLSETTVGSVAFKMASLIELPNDEIFTSHSLRRTRATLLALAGRTEEDIMAMGNWSNSSSCKRYIQECLLTKKKMVLQLLDTPCLILFLVLMKSRILTLC